MLRGLILSFTILLRGSAPARVLGLAGLVAAGTVGLGTGATGQAPASEPPGMEDIGPAFKQLDEGAYLWAIDRLRSASGSRESPAFSLWWQTHPFLTGMADMSATEEAAPAPSLDQALADQYRRAMPRDAIAAIVERARKTSIVILNEAHHSPRDRAFALNVARALRPLGYSILAMEALANDSDPSKSAEAMGALASNGYPRLKNGFYIMDPVFGDFVRQSLALGYRPVAYEQVREPGAAPPADAIAAREQAQAENLMARIFTPTPDAKVFIYVGYSHAGEAPVSGRDWMAARLKRMTGIDPLTIDQTTISETGESPVNRAYYALAAGKASRRPVILMVDGKPLVSGQYANAIDLQIVHPRARLDNGRYAWLRGMGRRAVAIPQSLRPRSGRRLVQAFVASEGADAIPVDQVLIEAGKPAPKLMLPRRPVRYAFQDPEPKAP